MTRTCSTSHDRRSVIARLSLETTLQETFSDHRASGKADAATGSGDSQSALHASPRKVALETWGLPPPKAGSPELPTAGLGAESGMLKRRGGSGLRLALKSTALPRDPDPPRAAAGKGAASSEQGRPRPTAGSPELPKAGLGAQRGVQLARRRGGSGLWVYKSRALPGNLKMEGSPILLVPAGKRRYW